MREWIVTNGLGGYASLTHQNRNSRKFHGLLIASLLPPTKRWVFVSNIYDQIQIKQNNYNLMDLRYKFLFNVFPTFQYEFNGFKLKKTVFMPFEKNTTVIKYEVNTKTPMTIIHTPLVTSRHFYDVNKHDSTSFKTEYNHHNVTISPGNIDKKLRIFVPDSDFTPDESLMEFSFEKDRERNDAWIDTVLKVGEFQAPIENSKVYYLVLTIEEEYNDNPAELFKQEVQRKQNILSRTHLSEKFRKLVLSTDTFLVKKDRSKSIIAGYHWFSDWGRDAMIALPGITLVTRRFSDAREILTTFSQYCKNGLIPNVFIDRESQAVYNTVDASLWFIDRVFQYLKYTNDQEFLVSIWPTLQSIIEFHQRGTDYNIHMDHDYLISHEDGLTWMDVKIDNYYPTPRAHKAVEIQALWYNALKIMSILARLMNQEDPYFSIGEQVKENFTSQYDKLYDVLDTRDVSFRPNQIFLVSLDFSMIKKTVQEKIVQDVQEKLLTIFGLRTLSSDHPLYKGSYLGDYHRDIAYHNGTVWPWLLGPFITAFVKVNNHEVTRRRYAFQQFLQPMFNIFGENWDGTIHEIFDADPPYLPRGCITQAWSVAEILRTWVEDIDYIRPNYEDQFYIK